MHGHAGYSRDLPYEQRLRDVLGEGPETIGWVNAFLGAGLVAGTALANRFTDRLRSARSVLVLLALNGIGTLIYVGTSVLMIVVVGGIVGGLSLAVLGQVEQQWQLFVVYSVFAAGWAAAGLVPVTTVVTRWFHTRRSVALSVASTGLSVGGIVLTPLAKRLLDEKGAEPKLCTSCPFSEACLRGDTAARRALARWVQRRAELSGGESGALHPAEEAFVAAWRIAEVDP